MKALVLCGGNPQAYLINELHGRGITAIVADRNERVPAVALADAFFPVSTLDVDVIRQLAIAEKVDFIISVCADQMLLVAAQISEELGLPCYIDYETAKNVSNKEYMKRIFVENGVPTAKHIACKELSMDDIANMKYPLIVKPVDCYSSRGVKRVENENELKVAFANAVELSRTGSAIVEEFIGGEEMSVDYYIENGEAKLLCARTLDKIPGYDGFVICRGRYPAPLSEELCNKVLDVGQKIANAFGLKNTPMLVQMKLENEKLYVLEFCARTGGGIKYRLLPKVSGFDVVKAVADLTLGEKPHCDVNKYNGFIVDEFLYCNEGVLDRIEGLEELLSEGVINHYEIYKPKGFKFGVASCSGDRVAYFSIESESEDDLKCRYRIANEKIHAYSDMGEDLLRHEILTYNQSK